MADLMIPCFVEDDAHRAFFDALLARLSAEEGWGPRVVRAEFRSSAHGRGAAMSALERYLRDARVGRAPVQPLLVILVDGNCERSASRKRAILRLAGAQGFPADAVVVGVPDPHIERWLLDGQALKAGVDPKIAVHVPKHKCERNRYKSALREAFRGADIHPPAGGVEYSADIVPHLDLERPGCGDSALKVFADDLRAALRRLRGSGAA